MSQISASIPPDFVFTGDLKTILVPIQSELTGFKTFYEQSLKTEVLLLNLLLKYLSRMKGKEIRPTLVFLSAKTAGTVSERSFVAATMIELLHTATLIHDDVVDDADRRRGLFSINKVWRNKASVLLGDYLLSKGLLVALQNREYELLKIVSDAVRRMSEGELRQMKASSLQQMTREKYFKIISDKTASLFSACCETGAVSVNASETHQAYFREIGESIGIAFQIKDDLLDYGSEDIGKPIGNDIKERKITLPFIEAFEASDSKTAVRIKRLFSQKEKSKKDINEIVTFVHQNGGFQRSYDIMLHHAAHAQKLLQHFPESDSRNALTQTIHYITQRSK